MANFTININPDTPYTADNITISQEVCGSVQGSTQLGVATNNDSLSPRFLLKDVITSSPWTNLIIDNISYSNSLSARLSYNGETINSSNTPYTINISSVQSNEPIPGLEVVYSLLEGGSVNNTIEYTVKLETTTQTSYDALNGNIIVKNTGCFQPSEPSVSSRMASTKGECGDGEAQAFTVSSQLNSSVKWVIEELDPGNHGYFLDIVETDSVDGTNIRNIVRIGPSWNDRFIIENYNTSQKHYRVSLCARPRITNDINEVEVRIHIRNTADTENVFSITLRDDDL